MKIAEVKTYLIHAPIPERHRVESGAGRKLARQMCLVEIKTDDGLSGFGSPSGPYDLGILDRIIRSVIAPHIIGSSAADTEFLWHKLYYGEILRNVGNRGVGIAALSGIDMALWDLKGRAARKPIYDLLGGLYHQHGVRAYASSIYWGLNAEQAAAESVAYVKQDYTAVKLKIGREPLKDVQCLRAIRRAVGTEIDVLVDANQSLCRADALAILPALEEARVYWFEEPLSIDDIEGHKMLRQARRAVRIATGENLYARFAFAEFIRQEALDVLQADVSRAGGFTEVTKIANLAAAHHLDWNPHTFNDALTAVANLHLVAASAHPAMFEWDITYNDLMTRLVTGPLVLKYGRLTPPAEPGLGVEIDWDFVKAHSWRGEPSIELGHGMRGS